MYDYLVDHAIKNVWCNPGQDGQYIVVPHRLSPKVGYLNVVRMMYRTIELPTRGSYYHLFQIGQINPILLSLMPNNPQWTREKWISLADCCTKNCMMVDIYSDKGIQIPRHEVYYLVSEEKNLIIAIKENKKIPINYSADTIYFRVYDNAYYESIRADSSVDGIIVKGKTIATTGDILIIQSEINLLQAKYGNCNLFKNGYLVDSINLANTKLGDVVEYVYDSSVKRVIELIVEYLPVYESELDSARKYLLHYPWTGREIIEYHDDIDIYVVDEYSTDKYTGVYYHRNVSKSCRMVTHRDYGLLISHVRHFTNVLANARSGVILPEQLKLKLFIRKSGYDRPLVFEHNRLHELFKLDDDRILAAMVGTDSTVENWTASNLENSNYCKLMRSEANNVNRELIIDAYGYNALSVLLGNTPKQSYLYSGKQQVTVNYGLQQTSTAYEYDEAGILIGHHLHNSGTVYNAVDNNARLIEIINGIGTNQPEVIFGENNILLPRYDNYRVYYCHRVNNDLDYNWTDITGTAYYRIVDNVLQWTGLDYNQFIMIRTDRTFLNYELGIIPSDSIIRFTISELEDRGDGIEHYAMPVPAGELDIFLNGYSLIENIDYYVNFPEVVIVNKSYLTGAPNTSVQKILVRFTGFCNSDFSRDVADDHGFVIHGTLSHNNRFDIRDDRVMRIIVDGRCLHRDQLYFSELHAGISVTNVDNGKPYSIKDIVVPMKDLIATNTYDLRNQSIAVDNIVADYMTRFLPQPDRPAPSAITNRHIVISPFIAKVMYDLLTNHYFTLDKLLTINDTKVLELCKPYEQWLEFDPINPKFNTDTRFIEIHPHNHYNTVPLNLYQYRFLRRVIDLYARGLVDISHFVTLANIEDFNNG
jgi:hypothetical protein